MPLYEYQCAACTTVSEVHHKMSENGPDTCTSCGKGPMSKLMSKTAFVLKGGGWYGDGYTSSKKPETKSEPSTTSTPAPSSTAACAKPGCGTGGCST
jgi:putative FmdB family regulatory protein